MKKNRSAFFSTAKQCWNRISFKDKGLILVMSLLLLQCIHNLYNEMPIAVDYMAINVIVRTSVAGIFGYFLSSNFLKNKESKKYDNATEIKLEILEEILQNGDRKEYIEGQGKLIKNIEEDEKESEDVIKCNTNLQNGIAVGMCLVILLALIVGVNFNLINDNTTATISLFRDIISGSIGFLLGSSDK